MNLTPRERDILHLLVTGKTAPQIALERHLSVETVREYVKRVYTKLGVRSRAECVLAAVRNQLV